MIVGGTQLAKKSRLDGLNARVEQRVFELFKIWHPRLATI